MPEPTYRLNHEGKQKLKTLLDGMTNKPDRRGRPPIRTVQGREIWNRSLVAYFTGLDRDSIQKVLPAVDPSAGPHDFGLPVHNSTLVQLFSGLCARQTAEKLCPESAKWPFWEQYEEAGTISKRPERLATLLRSLDYVEQQSQFDQALRASPGMAAFLIPTPCYRSQQWAINRLAYSCNNADKALRLPLINVDKHRIRVFGVDELWCQLAEKLKIKNYDQSCRDEVLRKLGQEAKNRPAIIGIYNFGEDHALTPQDVIEQFWVPLLTALSTPPRTVRSQIVLLIADRDIPAYSASHVTHLSPLSIKSQDVATWLGEDEVYRWCCSEFEKKWVDDLMNNGCSGTQWEWGNPGKILDRLCFTFQLPNGIHDLRRKWEWS